MDLTTIDVDQHLFEGPSVWGDHIDPAFRDDALAITDDAHGWPFLTWRGQHLYPIEIQHPGNPEEIGQNRLRMERGEEAPGRYEDLLPPAYGGGSARLRALDDFGLDACVLFPNFGLIWEGALDEDLAAKQANLTAYNRWMVETTAEGAGRLFGVAHLNLRDPAWAVAELDRLGRADVRLAMIGPAPVDGKALSHPDLDPVWQAFCDNGIAPVFHVAGFQSPLDPAWHQGEHAKGDNLLDSVFLWVAPAVALANMIVHGVFDRFPDLRLGVVELTAGWVPSFLLNIDGAYDFYTARHGVPYGGIARRPSEYFYDHIRVAALPYESPARLVRSVGQDTFMVGSDWPHAEGVLDPLPAMDRAAADLTDEATAKLRMANAAWLLHL
jgi:predicted TIM-barrel fold metal-dependent hydrolase